MMTLHFFTYARHELCGTELQELAMRAIVAESDSYDEADILPVADTLVELYVKLAETEGKTLDFTESHKESLELYRHWYYQCFPDSKGEVDFGNFPDTLTCKGALPKDIVILAGKEIGTRDRLKRQAWHDYCVKHDVANLSVEELKQLPAS